MSAETTLNSTLLAAAPVTAVVGSGDAARIYPDVVPVDAAVPGIAYTRINTEVVGTFSSPMAARKAVLECWCIAESRAEAENLADLVAAAVVAAWFIPSSRRSEFDAEAELWASVLILEYWES